MTTITWLIEWMQTSTTEIDGHAEVVLTAGWRCNGTQTQGDNTFSGSVYGSQGVSTEDTGTFTPYADLTQEQVLGWIWDSGVDKDAQEANVAAQIENQVNPTVVTPPLPWAA